MDLIYIGKITSFHGIKGELRIISEFDYPEVALAPNNKIIIDSIEHTVKSYRKHKHYDMITIDDYNNINDVMFLKNKKVYIDRSYLKNIDLDDDLIGMKIIVNNQEKGTLKEIRKISSKKKILVVEYMEKEVLIPYEFIININNSSKEINIQSIEGLGL